MSILRFSFLFLFIFSCFSIIYAQKINIFDEKDLQINWELVSNNYQGTSHAYSVFTLTNNGKKTFPSTGWEMFFSCSRDIENAEVPGGILISHVNGDNYKITPTALFTGIQPKSSFRVEYFSDGLSINYSAAPRGLYIVWTDNPTKGQSITHFSITPLKNTVPDMVTPERVFRLNSTVEDLSVDRLPVIFPTPADWHLLYGKVTLTPKLSIQSDPSFQPEANYLATLLGRMFGVPLTVRYDKDPATIMLQKSDQGDEAYSLTAQEDRITITAGTGAGVFYGIQSLWSMLPASAWDGVQTALTIPAAEVQDAPRFGYRSLMIDVARNFKPKSEILRILDLMALYKMNVLHFHLTDDEGWRLEIPSLPELTQVGAQRGHSDGKKTLLPSFGSGPEPGKTLGSGYFSRNEFIEILRYAKARHIRVIPEIEAPGHARAAIRAMDARYESFMKQGNTAEAEKYLLRDLEDRSVYSSAQLWNDNVLCVALPSVYRFIEQVVDEIARMYADAGAPLESIHMGGDEVPAGVWEKSPACRRLIASDPALNETNDLWYYFYGKVNAHLRSRGLYTSAWEEAGMRATKRDGDKVLIVNPRFANDGFQLHVWNNVVGWGNEDLPYRLANAGYRVVLSPVSNNYFDLAYMKHPDEPGYYWGGFQDLDKPFYFNPFDYYKTTSEGPDGAPVAENFALCKERLTDFGKSNIVGIEGLLWAENLNTTEQLEYLLLPKMLGVAERAWAKDPEWANAADKTTFKHLYDAAWSRFVNVVGKRELPRLDHFAGGFQYRIPWPGATIENGAVVANIQLPGLQIRYTSDGTEPTTTSRLYNGPVSEKGILKFKAFDGRGRGSLTSTVDFR